MAQLVRVLERESNTQSYTITVCMLTNSSKTRMETKVLKVRTAKCLTKSSIQGVCASACASSHIG